MKLRITPEDLAKLSKEQQKRLRFLWTPKPFDQAVTYICKNADSDLYEEKEFVIGKVECSISSTNQAIVILDDLSQMSNEAPSEDSKPDELEKEDDWYEVDESALTTESQPVSPYFYKDFSLPLLDIGQLMELLQRTKYGEEYFYITIAKDPEGLSTLGRDGCGADYEEAQICDILWKCIIELL